jgi:hypothetical protein
MMDEDHMRSVFLDQGKCVSHSPRVPAIAFLPFSELFEACYTMFAAVRTDHEIRTRNLLVPGRTTESPF